MLYKQPQTRNGWRERVGGRRGGGVQEGLGQGSIGAIR